MQESYSNKDPNNSRIAELYQQLAPLEEEHDKLNSEARQWAEKRNTLHGQIKKLRDKAQERRQKRDTLNKRVQELKTLREEANKKREEKRAQIQELKGEIMALNEKKPSKSMNNLQEEIKQLEWRIQTTSLTLNEEETLIDQVRTLEKKLLIHKKLQNLDNSLDELRNEEKESESGAKAHHEEILELAERSQEFHKEMLEALDEAGTLQIETDKINQRFLEAKQKAQSLYERLELIKEELHRIEEAKKARHELELRKDLEKKASEKLKRGEQLTLEELKILAEKGII